MYSGVKRAREQRKSCVINVNNLNLGEERLPARQPYTSTLKAIFTFHVCGLIRTIFAVKVWTSCLTTVLESVLPERVYKKMARPINVVITVDILIQLASDQIFFSHANKDYCCLNPTVVKNIFA